ncbi:MAG TPA: ergothioneine biosynthesis protein EgtB [Xanthomonadaceae bacterium]|nr:ergothioneine biosynthesis protein EgtB [Xanthomonadaceae bacterium]
MSVSVEEFDPESGASALADRFVAVRRRSEALVQGLSAEDLGAQSMPDASPGKWHLAHTTWFFEVLVLAPALDLGPLRPGWHFLFNSYYEALGARHPRPQRGLLTRPALDEVLAYRQEVEGRVLELLTSDAVAPRTLEMLELGLHHEQQHQELLVTDLKHLLFQNPLQPAWRTLPEPGIADETPPRWVEWPGAGTVEIGHPGPGFAYDNEGPRHRQWLEPFAVAARPVSHGEYLAFIEDGGYREPRLWLSDGWDAVQREGWQAPLYWVREEDGWRQFTVAGKRDIDPAEPVCHISYYEADAYARWSGARLPTEAEWESLMQGRFGNAADADRLHPAAGGDVGEVWEWTASAYAPYPGFRAAPGAEGEYNGKFMSGQMVLRGGSCASPPGHVRPTYRNFFPPAARWQFAGLRLAR